MKHIPDLLILAGATSFVAGVALIFVPAALMVGGLLLFTFGWMASKR